MNVQARVSRSKGTGMITQDDAPAYAVCDGCGMFRADVDELGDLLLCPGCTERRAEDTAITVQGRTMPLSELRMQAEDDEHLAAALADAPEPIRAAIRRAAELWLALADELPDGEEDA